MRDFYTSVFNHGYVKLIEVWGSDERVIESARMSTDKGFQGWNAESIWACDHCNVQIDVPHNDKSAVVEHAVPPHLLLDGRFELDHDHYVRPETHRLRYASGHNGDEKLLKYLYDNWHHTPFEHAGMTVEIQAPIFVFREWHRHRTQSYNELSARYTELPDLFYIPFSDRISTGAQSTTNKQGSEAGGLTKTPVDVAYRIAEMMRAARANYKELLSLGLSRELARIVIPVAQYSRMRASANLRNWLAFLTLRLEPNAQHEIRAYAQIVAALVAQNFPRTSDLFTAKRVEATVTTELYYACRALVSTLGGPSGFEQDGYSAVERIKNELDAVARIKAEVAKIEAKQKALGLA